MRLWGLLIIRVKVIHKPPMLKLWISILGMSILIIDLDLCLVSFAWIRHVWIYQNFTYLHYRISSSISRRIARKNSMRVRWNEKKIRYRGKWDLVYGGTWLPQLPISNSPLGRKRPVKAHPYNNNTRFVMIRTSPSFQRIRRSEDITGSHLSPLSPLPHPLNDSKSGSTYSRPLFHHPSPTPQTSHR